MDFRLSGALACASMMLLACGGGGGGGSGPRLALSVDELEFARSASDGTSPQATITGTLSGNPSSLYLLIQHTASGIQAVSTPDFAGTSGSSVVYMRPGEELGHGVYTDSIVINACVDAQCSRQYAGSPATVSVKYTVGIPADRDAVQVTIVEGEPANAGTVSFSSYEGSRSWTVQAGAVWLTPAPAAGGTLPAQTSLQLGARPVGMHETALTIAAGAEQHAIPVTYAVLPLLEAAFEAPVSVTNANAYDTISFETPVRSRISTRNADWTATIDGLPWVTLSQPSGNTGASSVLALEIDPEALRSVANGTYDVAVNLSSTTPGVSPISVPLQIIVDRTVVNVAAPHAVNANQAGELILSGDRLTELGEIESVMLGDVAATSVTVEGTGPHQLRVAYPPLAAGTHPVTLLAGDRTAGSIARVAAAGSTGFVAAGPSPAVEPSASLLPWIYDAERQSFYRLPSLQEGPVQALRLGASGWVVEQSEAICPPIIGAALSQTGDEIMALDSDRQILSIDPATLSLRTSTPSELPQSATLHFNGPAAAHDGSFWVPADFELRRYDAFQRSVDLVQQNAQSPVLAPSAAGNMLLGYRPISEGSGVYRFDALTRTLSDFAASPTMSITSIVGDRFGDRWALVGEPSHGDGYVEIRSADGALLGSVDPRPSHFIDAYLTADGTRLLLTFERRVIGSSSSPEPRLEIYDLTAEPVAGLFPLLATVPLSGEDYSMIGTTPDRQELLLGCCSRITAIALP